MRFGIYTIYDCKSKEFSSPFIQREGAVERTVKDLVSKSPVPAEDLTLWQVGIWESEDGCISDGTFDPASDGISIYPSFINVDFLGREPNFDDEDVVE